MADCMYFVSDGVVRILDPDSGKLLTTIAKGSYFGEFALLQVGPPSVVPSLLVAAYSA